MGEFYAPIHIYSGPGALERLRHYNGQGVLLVTDHFFMESGVVEKIRALLPESKVTVFDQVTADPPAALAAQGAALCRRHRPGVLVALGGGSPMDCAKAIRLASEMEMSFVAIPTTSGSGAEATSFSILTHDGIKKPLVDPLLRPDAAILEPTLLEAMPKALIADTGMDLLAHCLEAVAATGATAFSDALAHGAARLAFAHLEQSYRGETAVRLFIHEAATMAGMAFDNAGLGVLHALAHSLGGVLHLPHGRLCAMLMPPVLAANAPAARPAYAALARQCGLQAATDALAVRDLTAALCRLRRRLGLPANLREAGVAPETVAAKREEIVAAALADRCCETNPLPVTRAMVEEILKAVVPWQRQ